MFHRMAGMSKAGSCLLSACIAVSPLLAFNQESRSLPKESDLLANPGLIGTWSERMLADDRKTREKAAAELVQGGAESLPVLRHSLLSSNERLRQEAFEIIRRIGAGALPLLTELLGWNEASIARDAVSILIDLAPDTETAQPALIRALSDEDPRVARDAARALGALGERASPSVPHLVKALSHRDSVVRLYVAEALASIGPAAASATPDLTKALRDPDPGVRWAAGEGLAAIGPKAAPAVPELIETLKDEFLYVRICAAGALGSIGLKTEAALAALEASAKDPATRAEAEWALHQITGVAPGANSTSSADARVIRPRTGTSKPAATSSGVLAWGTRRLADPWFPAAWFMWEPTTGGKLTRPVRMSVGCFWHFERRMAHFYGRMRLRE